MNCLPIAGRELSVAARKRSTNWLRVAAAVTALVIGSSFFLVSTLQRTSAAQIGSTLFQVLNWMCLAAGLSVGLFFTSDCLSEEKREGTLGLLFLTELRGYDVVLGKLLATSLRGFYGLLALLPILAITQLMGGVTGAQYWKSSLALVNGLFISLAAGMLVSALSRDSQKALTATLLLLLLLSLGGVGADAIIAAARKRGFQPVWSLSSPGYVLAAASAWGRSAYWTALIITQLLGWAMFGLACGLVPYAWQERKRRGATSTGSWTYAWKYGGIRRRQRLRRSLLEQHPIAWLGCRERWQSQALWVFLVLTSTGFFLALLWKVPREAWIIWNYIGGLFTLVLYLWAASQAGRTLVEARRSGLLELLLVTPLSESRIVGGQWRAFLRMFGLPVLLLLGVHVAGATLSQLSFQRLAAQAGTVAAPAITNQAAILTNQATPTSSVSVRFTFGAGTNAMPSATGVLPMGSRAQQTGMAVGAALAAALGTAANLLALFWFGMWMGLTSKTTNQSTLKTILFVQVIPWFVTAFASATIIGLVMARGFVRGGNQTMAWLGWWPLLSAAIAASLAVAKDVGFIIWSRNRLRNSFRNQAARSLGLPRFARPPPAPQPMAAPAAVSGG
ncbi:MAG TPA: hypothetical protein VJA21_12555 [Verrucomicrobiae bacterium]